jgi:hypothetical protein
MVGLFPASNFDCGVQGMSSRHPRESRLNAAEFVNIMFPAKKVGPTATRVHAPVRSSPTTRTIGTARGTNAALVQSLSNCLKRGRPSIADALDNRHEAGDELMGNRHLDAAPDLARLRNVSRIAELDVARLLSRECRLGPLRNPPRPEILDGIWKFPGAQPVS